MALLHSIAFSSFCVSSSLHHCPRLEFKIEVRTEDEGEVRNPLVYWARNQWFRLLWDEGEEIRGINGIDEISLNSEVNDLKISH